MRVVSLGALCDLSATGNDQPRQHSFSISEFAVLDDGRRIVLHNERGFTAGTNAEDIWASESIESLTRDVLNTVLPDDDESGDEHPWEWLAELTRARGVEVTGNELRSLPYEVEFTDAVLRRLPNH